MKHKFIITLISISFMLTSCYSLFPNVKPFTSISPNMTQAEVERRLGKPELIRFNMENEEWEYNQLSASYTTCIIIRFVNKTVVAMDMFNIYPNAERCQTPTTSNNIP